MKSKLFLVLAISAGVFSSCDSDSTKIEFDGAGDIYVRCQKVEGVTQYAPVFFAYSNMYMSSATVTHSDADNSVKNLEKEGNNAITFFCATVAHSDADSPVINLEKEGNNAITFFSLPTALDYSTTDIKNGVYNFTLTSTDGEVLNVTDKLLELRITPVEISKFDYNEKEHKLDIEWGTVENRDIYHVKIATKIDGVIVYRSARLNNNSLIITPASDGWNKDYIMKSGTTYTVSVSAYKFENPTTQHGVHINQESIAYKTIEW